MAEKKAIESNAEFNMLIDRFNRYAVRNTARMVETLHLKENTLPWTLQNLRFYKWYWSRYSNVPRKKYSVKEDVRSGVKVWDAIRAWAMHQWVTHLEEPRHEDFKYLLEE